MDFDRDGARSILALKYDLVTQNLNLEFQEAFADGIEDVVLHPIRINVA